MRGGSRGPRPRKGKAEAPPATDRRFMANFVTSATATEDKAERRGKVGEVEFFPSLKITEFGKGRRAAPFYPRLKADRPTDASD